MAYRGVEVDYSGCNLPIEVISDVIRRCADRVGRPGIVAKKGLTDTRLRRRQSAELYFYGAHCRRNAIKFQDNLDQALEVLGTTSIRHKRWRYH